MVCNLEHGTILGVLGGLVLLSTIIGIILMSILISKRVNTSRDDADTAKLNEFNAMLEKIVPYSCSLPTPEVVAPEVVVTPTP